MKKFLLSSVLIMAMGIIATVKAQTTVYFENYSAFPVGSIPTGWNVSPNTDIANYSRPGTCSVTDKGLQTPGVGRNAPMGLVLPQISYDVLNKSIIVRFKIYVFDANLKCISAKDFPCETFAKAYLVPASWNDPVGTPTASQYYAALPDYQILYANADNSMVFSNVSLPAGVTDFKVLLNFKTAPNSNCSASGTKFVFDDIGVAVSNCPSGICSPVANNDYFNADAQSLFAPGTSFSGNVYGGYATWSNQLPAGFGTHSLDYNPAVNSGADYDLNNTNLNAFTFTQESPLVVEAVEGCIGTPSPGTLVFNSNGTFTYTKGSACVKAVSFTYKITSNTTPPLASSIAKVVIDMPGSNIVLPVLFKSFTATRNKTSVALRWTTSIEHNNRGFNVQKSVEGAWKNIAFVFSLTDDGNSTSDVSYAFNDQNTTKGITQYRIEQIDMDGKVKYSDIRAVRDDVQPGKVVVYPNPSSDGKINVVFEEAGSVKDVLVSDIQGRIVKQYRGISNNVLTIDKLTSGFYTLKITDRNTTVSSVEKVVVK